MPSVVSSKTKKGTRVMRFVIMFALMSTLCAQVTPTHVLLTEDLSDPTHPKVFGTFPSTGADSYNVYEALDVKLDFSCPAFGSLLTNTQTWPDGSIHRVGSPAYVLGETLAAVPIPGNVDYPDDPNPGLNQVPAVKQAGGRGWCYAVSSVVNGQNGPIESPVSTPQMIWLGYEGYYAWVSYTICGGPAAPYPLPITSYHPLLIYRDPSGVNHRFSYLNNSIINNHGTYEIEFHLPVIAQDGTMVPMLDASRNGKASYYVQLFGGDYTDVETMLPYRQGDHVWYNQIGTNFLLGGHSYIDDCYGSGSSDWWQDTSY